MRCYLVRHAQTAWNGENRLQGHTDLPLSPLGQEQAKRLGTHFGALRAQYTVPSRLYTSHLVRSLQTAQAIADQTGIPLLVEPHLAEACLGVWEGLTPEEVDARYDGAYQRWRTAPSTVQIPEAEPLAQFRARVRGAFARIIQAHPEEELIVVSHGGVMASLLADWLEADYDGVLRRVVLENAGISACDARTRPPHVLWVNDTHHLRAASQGPPVPSHLLTAP